MTDQTQIGKTDLFVHPIGLGANAVGGHNLYPGLDEETGRHLVRTALDHGSNFLDTAFIYGPKRSEELIGEAVKERGNRSEAVIATKAAHTVVDGKAVMDNSPAFLKQSVDEALQRLQTDYIDLFYIHCPDEQTPKEEAVGALKELKDAGKIRAIGVSNFSLEQLKEANQDGYVDVFQGEYNLFSREAEKKLFPYVLEHKISFVPYFPLASGLLTGKYDSSTVFHDLRKNLPYFQKSTYKKNLEKVDKLRGVAEAKKADMTHVVLAWYLTREAIDVIIPGAKRAEQAIDNMRTLNVKLTKAEIEEIDRIFQ